jgi:hypothetical protein
MAKPASPVPHRRVRQRDALFLSCAAGHFPREGERADWAPGAAGSASLAQLVEQENGGRVVVYQVRRYAALTPAKITRAVTEYARPPSPPGAPKPARRFAAGKYVLLTSALFEHDTALAELREAYRGDLVIDWSTTRSRCWKAWTRSRPTRGPTCGEGFRNFYFT